VPPGLLGLWAIKRAARETTSLRGGLRTIGRDCERALSGRYFHEQDSEQDNVVHDAKYGR